MNEIALAQQAERLLRSGCAGDPLVAQHGRTTPPYRITAPDGVPAGWLVGIAVVDQLAGFLQFTPTGELLRYSSFQRRPGSLAGCPLVADWLDPATIRQHAQTQAAPDETLGEPLLTYDHAPTRLVWAVPTRHGDGRAGVICVIGTYAYRPPTG